MTISEGPGGKGTKIIKTKYPIDEGLNLGTNKLPKKPFLKPTKTYVRNNDKTGL